VRLIFLVAVCWPVAALALSLVLARGFRRAQEASTGTPAPLVFEQRGPDRRWTVSSRTAG
jgi:hypothetical protein